MLYAKNRCSKFRWLSNHFCFITQLRSVPMIGLTRITSITRDPSHPRACKRSKYCNLAIWIFDQSIFTWFHHSYTCFIAG